MGLILGFHGQDISYKIHSFIHYSKISLTLRSINLVLRWTIVGCSLALYQVCELLFEKSALKAVPYHYCNGLYTFLRKLNQATSVLFNTTVKLIFRGLQMCKLDHLPWLLVSFARVDTFWVLHQDITNKLAFVLGEPIQNWNLWGTDDGRGGLRIISPANQWRDGLRHRRTTFL